MTSTVLDLGYDDAIRKFRTYRALEDLDKATPISAFPIISTEGGNMAMNRMNQAQSVIDDIIGVGIMEPKNVEPVPEDVIEKIFEMATDGPLVDIESFVKEM